MASESAASAAMIAPAAAPTASAVTPAGRAVPTTPSDDRHLHVEDRRQRVEQALPLLAALAAHPQLAGGGAEVERRRPGLVDVHPVAEHGEEAVPLRQPLRELLPRAAAVLAPPYAGRGGGTGARHRLERQHIDGVGVVRMDRDREAKVRGQALGDRVPAVAVIVAAQHADVGARSAGTVPAAPAAVVLHVEAARRVLVADHLVHALAELRIRIGLESRAHARVRGLEGDAAVLAQVVAAGRDAEMHAVAV